MKALLSSRAFVSIFFRLCSLHRFEVSLHNPSRKLHKAMLTGTLPYFFALTDTHCCLSYNSIIQSIKIYVNEEQEIRFYVQEINAGDMI